MKKAGILLFTLALLSVPLPSASAHGEVAHSSPSQGGHRLEGDYSFTVGQDPIARSTGSKEKDKPVNGSQSEPESLSFAAIFIMLLLAISGFSIIKRSRKR